MSYPSIGAHGIIGDLSTAALVCMDGTIDWLCLPTFSSPSLFASLLDREKGGRFRVGLEGEFHAVQEYLEGTAILQTRMRNPSGAIAVTDFMPIAGDEAGQGGPLLVRHLEALAGGPTVVVEFSPRYPYGIEAPGMSRAPTRAVAEFPGLTVTLLSSRPVDWEAESGRGRLELRQGQSLSLALYIGSPAGMFPAEKGMEAMERLARWWRSWLQRDETGRPRRFGPYRRLVERSAITLKLLQFRPTGALVAAPTTSLPEEIGGQRNWDYRYCWIRDAAFTVEALYRLGHLAEMESYFRWLATTVGDGGASSIQVMYGIEGQRELPERILHHLEGYRGSRPVRVGNGAVDQLQLDIFGEIMLAAMHLSDYVGRIDHSTWPLLRQICDHVVEAWSLPDHGIWEPRSGPAHHTLSKAMCWAALDKGIKIAQRYGFPADIGRWQGSARRIFKEVMEKGWSPVKGAFRQRFGHDDLDAALLLLPKIGFLPYDHPKMVATVQAITEELSHHGFLRRYSSEDGLSGGEGTFLLCSFWLIDALLHQGRRDEAEALMERALGAANHLGLFPEEYDPVWHEPLGNFPQALTHIGFINTVAELTESQEGPAGQARPVVMMEQVGDGPLNQGDAGAGSGSAMEIADRLKELMNRLRGAFFLQEERRVAYGAMAASPLYGEFLSLAPRLQAVDLGTIATDGERLAFWINLYNVMTIHGVIAHGVKESVREVPRFFQRVSYRVGGHIFSLDDIEHGILRGNRRPPYGLFRPFSRGDARLQFVVERLDPRIHFALVCGAASCPPIGVYSPDQINRQLDHAAMAFINGHGVELRREEMKIALSRIFKWYGGDFGDSQVERLLFISQFLYDPEQAWFVAENASRLKVVYLKYDWRLNAG